VSRRALRRGGLGAVAIALALAGAGAGGVYAAVDGYFFGQTSNASSTFASGWVSAPTGTSASASGYDVGLSWTAGHGVTSQSLSGADGGTAASASCGSYSQLNASVTSPTTDSNRANGTLNGHWYCYQLTGSHGSWSAAGTFTPLQIGLAATSITITNVATANSIAKNDTIALTFNQQPATPPASILVCTYTSGTIVLGDTTGNCTGGPHASSLGTITGTTVANNRSFTSSGVVRTGNTDTITVGTGTATATGTGTKTYTPSASILSAALTDQATVCTAAVASCRPTTTGNF
jgi:hypothetical protein